MSNPKSPEELYQDDVEKAAYDFDMNWEFTGEYSSLDMDEAFRAGIKWANSHPAPHIREVLEYCKPHLDQMWAATIVGMLLKCDFRDAKSKLADYERHLK